MNDHCFSPKTLRILLERSVTLKSTKNKSVSGKNFWKVSPKMGTTEKVPMTWLKELFSMSRIDRKLRHSAEDTREKLLQSGTPYIPEYKRLTVSVWCS